MRIPTALLLTAPLLAGCSLSEIRHRPLASPERAAVDAAVELIRRTGFEAEAALLEGFNERGKIRAADGLTDAEMYEKTYAGFVTLAEWIHVRSSLLEPGSPRTLGSWLVHSARHAMGDGESAARLAQFEFELRTFNLERPPK
ncbi:MAG TPA: hypothetical protein VI643_03025 [Planctomycetota bacterium]|nr:hypothetical protein [Planctomycetota bacterium]